MDKIKLNVAEIGAALLAYLVETGQIEKDCPGCEWHILAENGNVIIQGGTMQTVEIIIEPFKHTGEQWGIAEDVFADRGKPKVLNTGNKEE